MKSYPEPLVPPGGVARCPRRLRGVLGGATLFDTEDAWYVWEFPPYPQYYVPFAALDRSLLVDEGHAKATRRGRAASWGLRVGDIAVPGAVQVYGDDAPEELRGTARVDFGALDAWYEEDELIFVHPRNPYSRVDALRSTRSVRIELDGVVLAEASSLVRLFETGLPPRHYVDRSALKLEHLEPSPTVTACPYKGVTTDYWSARIGDTLHRDIAWSYRFPTLPLTPIAGLVAFYDEKVDTDLDGVRLDRPVTHFG